MANKVTISKSPAHIFSPLICSLGIPVAGIHYFATALYFIPYNYCATNVLDFKVFKFSYYFK